MTISVFFISFVLITGVLGKKCGYIAKRDNTPINDSYQLGDIILAHITGLHRSSAEKGCRHQRIWYDVQMAEGVKYVVDLANSNPDILPNITLGLLYLENCRRPLTTLSRAMQILGTDCDGNAIYT